MGFANKAKLLNRINTITDDVDGLDSDLWSGTIDEILNASKFEIAETLVNRGWTIADIQLWGRLEEIHICIALFDFIVNLEILKSEVEPVLLERLGACRIELKEIDILLDKDLVELPRGSTGADAGSPILSTSKGKARTHGRDYDNEVEPDDVFYLEEPFH